MTARGASHGRGAVWWLVGLVRPAWPRFALGIVAGAGALGSAVGLAALAAWLISRAAEHPPVLYLSMAIVGVRAFGIGRGVLRYVERVTTHDVAFRILADLRVRIIEALERLAPAGLPAFRRGDLLGRLVADVDDAQDLFLRVLVPPVIAVVVGGGAVAISTALLPAAGLILLVTLAVAGILAPWLAAVTSQRGERRVAALRGELNASTVELLDGAAELVAYGVADKRLATLDRLDARLTRLSARSARTSGVGSAITHLSTGAAVLGALLVGIPAVRSGALDRVNLAVIALLPLAAFEAVAALPLAAQYGQRLRRSAARVHEVLSAPAPVTELVPPLALPAAPYSLVTHRLTARWPGTERAAVQDVDLRLTPGRRVAVVGASGAGKSTVAAALLRFVESSGATLNGIPLERLDADDVRRVVGLCAQHAHLFDTTIRENVLLARRDASPAELRLALCRSRMEGWIESLPDGLDTQVGEHGATVSGGQRQRIALARALLADFPILLLDEPAANLDVDTADALTADLLDATRDRTVLLITHRLAGLDSVDEIVVLDGGHVIERGTHAELLAGPTQYRRWWDREQTADLFVHV